MNTEATNKDEGDLIHQITAILVKNGAVITPETTWVHDFTNLIHQYGLEQRIDELKRLKEEYHNNIVSDDRMDLEINERLEQLTTLKAKVKDD